MKRLGKQWVILLVGLITQGHLIAQSNNAFVTTEGGTFQQNGKPYYYIGTNYWYGAILGINDERGDRARLIKELDFFKKIGVDNLRILAGAEGPNEEPSRVTPAVQLEPGKYDDSVLDGLDFLMAELSKRNIKAILFLGNSWEWSGGYAQYLNWNGYGDVPYPNLPQYSWPDFMKYVNEFHKSCEPCKEQYSAFVRDMVSRTNRYTGIPYSQDPTLMSWEIANEPRAFSKENFESFEKWIADVAGLIKSIDPNHLVTTGTEGAWGCEGSIEVFKRIHSGENIDYLTMHIWPKNWRWLDEQKISETVDEAIVKTNEYMDQHIQVARELGKPLVLEEFGLPRDHHQFSLSDPTTSRDKYFQNAFEQVAKHAADKGVLAGCNFWAFGGTARPIAGQSFWKKGDALMGDPPQEEQGLNSVFDTDTTIKLVRKYNKRIRRIN